jgi:N4-gp56 family major capsid protein
LNLTNGADPDLIILDQFLTRPESDDVFDAAFTKNTIGMNQGEVVHFRRMQNPTIDTTTANGLTNKASIALTHYDYTATLNEYNESLSIGRREKELSSYSNQLKEHGNILADWIVPETRSAIRFNALKAGTNKFYPSSANTVRTDVAATLNANMLERMIRSIRNARGKYFHAKVEATNKVNTSGIEQSYRVYCHTDLEADIRLLPGVKFANEYAAEKNEFAAWQNCRFFTTQTATPYANGGASSSTLLATGATGSTAGNCDVYPVIMVAKDACNALSIKGSGMDGIGNVTTTVLDKADKSDIHNKLVVLGVQWKDFALITAQEWIAVGEVGASRL